MESETVKPTPKMCACAHKPSLKFLDLVALDTRIDDVHVSVTRRKDIEQSILNI